ncbi:MAG: 2-polyprenyl-3-methyl-6-methoxy-1,4-benzoquinone monooxygenase [Cytophagales bacterium]|nr:2-polyprenyl-3-methyl-6-methoxy-1,4-benzoquinone monooxygenase [Cytophagales bacterium]
MTHITLSPVDCFMQSADTALRTLFAKPRAARSSPQSALSAAELSMEEKRHAAGLMRVNHVGEICAQALYSAQALTAKTDALRTQFEQAAKEEMDHLAWTADRLSQLDSRPSLLNPLWYAGAFGLGLLAGRLGEGVSLGFLAETEAQVEAHLASHLLDNAMGLPACDHASRAIVAQMQQDEAAHSQAAKDAGATELSNASKELMRKAAKIMTTVAYRI